jgi:phage terminase large subunit
MPAMTIAGKLYKHLYHKVNGKPVRKTKRFIIIIGGRGSTKSWTAGDIQIMDVQTQGVKVACFREFQTTIEDSSHALIAGEIERMGVQGFEVTDKKIKY